jgi:Insertion element 4 transposase N-terminal/Transposase DDE domain
MSESATVTFARSITTAAGVYAPGHIGELTQYLPFELVDDVLSETKTVQRRLRDLPSRVGVYFVLALALFPRLGYARVWHKLTAGLIGFTVPNPSEKALRDLRRRLGPAPFKSLFEVVAGPLGQPNTPGVTYRGMRTVAFDGCNSLRVPDTERNRSWLGRIRYRMGFAGYPTLRMMTLIETGTRGILGAVLGSAGDRDEATLARQLLRLLGPGMVVLLDRAFDAAAFLTAIHETGAQFLVRSKSTRRPPVLSHLPDGSFLSDLNGLSVRIIDAELTVTGTDGSRVRDRYRLITTLLDHHRHPAAELVRLYHERWEIEIAYLALRHAILDGHVLRSQDRPGLEQEVWALLTVYQLLRMAMVTAVESRPDTNPDRASFTTAVQTARDQLIAADGILPTDRLDRPGRPDLLGAIGRAVLATLLPPRRLRWSTRTVKNATSRYLNRDDRRPHLPTAIASIDVVLHTPSVDESWQPRSRKSRNPNAVAAPTRRELITALMDDDPTRPWRGRELADRLGIKPRNMLTQLAEWTRLGFLTRTNGGTYQLATRRDAASP